MLRRAATLTALLAALTAAIPAAQATTNPTQQYGQPTTPKYGKQLRILLTNDDGYAFPFLQALRQALIAAGHEVTVVAPATDSSGSGTAFNARFGTTLEAAERSPGVWSVTGSPGDAVAFGLRVVMAQTPPDLVVSGPNAGQNVAAITNHSGTVGATIAALDNGVPAVAFSTAVDTSTTPPSFPSAAQSVAFAAKLVSRLSETKLPPHTALNVNYPVRPNGKVTFAHLGTSSFISTRYAPAPDVCPACYRILPVLSGEPDPVRDADRTLLDAGHVTITPIDGSWESGPIETAVIKTRLRNLTP